MKWDLALRQFDGYLRMERGMSSNTVKAYCHDLEALGSWAIEHERSPASISVEELRQAIRTMAEAGLGARTQAEAFCLACFLWFYSRGGPSGRPAGALGGPPVAAQNTPSLPHRGRGEKSF